MYSFGPKVNNYVIHDLVKRIRTTHFPNRLNVGDCITVCVLVASVLKYERGYPVLLVHGSHDGCLHTWLQLGDTQIDPATDCLTNSDGRELVELVAGKGYLVRDTEPFFLKNYFNGLTVSQLKEQYLAA